MNPSADLLALTPPGGWKRGVVVLDAADAAALLGVTTATLRKWVARGHVRKAGRNRYDMGEALNYLAGR